VADEIETVTQIQEIAAEKASGHAVEDGRYDASAIQVLEGSRRCASAPACTSAPPASAACTT
jgi:hypothetical protein